MLWLSVRWIPDWIPGCSNRTCYGLGIRYMAERWFKFSHLGGHLLEIGMEETKPGDVNGIQKRRQADRQRHDCVYGTQRDRLRQTKFQTKGREEDVVAGSQHISTFCSTSKVSPTLPPMPLSAHQKYLSARKSPTSRPESLDLEMKKISGSYKTVGIWRSRVIPQRAGNVWATTLEVSTKVRESSTDILKPHTKGLYIPYINPLGIHRMKYIPKWHPSPHCISNLQFHKIPNKYYS